jgi:hypothetical protein
VTPLLLLQVVVPLRHARHLSWGGVLQHNLRHPSTLCSEVCCPGELGVCVWFFTGGSHPVCVACFSGVEHCPWSPPFRQSPLRMPVVLGSVLSVLCVPSILVMQRTLPSLLSRVLLRRSGQSNPCNTPSSGCGIGQELCNPLRPWFCMHHWFSSHSLLFMQHRV